MPCVSITVGWDRTVIVGPDRHCTGIARAKVGIVLVEQKSQIANVSVTETRAFGVAVGHCWTSVTETRGAVGHCWPLCNREEL